MGILLALGEVTADDISRACDKLDLVPSSVIYLTADPLRVGVPQPILFSHGEDEDGEYEAMLRYWEEKWLDGHKASDIEQIVYCSSPPDNDGERGSVQQKIIRSLVAFMKNRKVYCLCDDNRVIVDQSRYFNY